MSTEISTNTTPARGLVLQTMADAMSYAKMVANSDFAPKDFRGKPESCLLAIDLGSSIGLSRIQSLQSIAVINGRPTIWGDAALALVQSSPVCEFISEAVDGDGEQMVATCTAKRRGYPQPTVVKFTVADAKKAGLWGKTGPWTQYPKRMLQMRSRGFALRDAFPDVLKGLVTAEEAQDYPTPVAADHGPAGGAYAAFVKPSEPVVVRPKFDERATETPEQKARHAIQRVKTLADCDRIRDLITARHAEGVFTDATRDDLVDLLHGKAEILIGEEEVTA
jgi:hypothetical protein